MGCRALDPIRGVPAVRHDGLVLFTDRTVLKVYARSAVEERGVARTLRPVRSGSRVAPLRPPPKDVRTIVARVCR